MAVVATALVVPSAQAATPSVTVTNTFHADTGTCTVAVTGTNLAGEPIDDGATLTQSEAQEQLPSLEEYLDEISASRTEIVREIESLKVQGGSEEEIASLTKADADYSFTESLLKKQVAAWQACIDGEDYDSSKVADDTKKELGAGEIVGIVIGSLAGLALIVAAIGAVTGMIPGIPKLI